MKKSIYIFTVLISGLSMSCSKDDDETILVEETMYYDSNFSPVFNFDLNIGVKALEITDYQASWDNATNTVIKGGVKQKNSYQFDKNGLCTLESLSDGYVYSYEYDSKYRVTLILESYAGTADISQAVLPTEKTTFGYDEQQRTATSYIYTNKDTSSGASDFELTSELIYQLNSNGHINWNLYETYPKNVRSAATTETPTFSNRRIVVSQDDKSNWTECYQVMESYDGSGNILFKMVTSYQERSIVYY